MSKEKKKEKASAGSKHDRDEPASDSKQEKKKEKKRRKEDVDVDMMAAAKGLELKFDAEAQASHLVLWNKLVGDNLDWIRDTVDQERTDVSAFDGQVDEFLKAAWSRIETLNGIIAYIPNRVKKIAAQVAEIKIVGGFVPLKAKKMIDRSHELEDMSWLCGLTKHTRHIHDGSLVNDSKMGQSFAMHYTQSSLFKSVIKEDLTDDWFAVGRWDAWKDFFNEVDPELIKKYWLPKDEQMGYFVSIVDTPLWRNRDTVDGAEWLRACSQAWEMRKQQYDQQHNVHEDTVPEIVRVLNWGRTSFLPHRTFPVTESGDAVERSWSTTSPPQELKTIERFFKTHYNLPSSLVGNLADDQEAEPLPHVITNTSDDIHWLDQEHDEDELEFDVSHFSLNAMYSPKYDEIRLRLPPAESMLPEFDLVLQKQFLRKSPVPEFLSGTLLAFVRSVTRAHNSARRSGLSPKEKLFTEILAWGFLNMEFGLWCETVSSIWFTALARALQIIDPEGEEVQDTDDKARWEANVCGVLRWIFEYRGEQKADDKRPFYDISWKSANQRDAEVLSGSKSRASESTALPTAGLAILKDDAWYRARAEEMRLSTRAATEMQWTAYHTMVYYDKHRTFNKHGQHRYH